MSDDVLVRALTREECDTIGDKVFRHVAHPYATLHIRSNAWSAFEFARGDTHVAGGGRGTALEFSVSQNGRYSIVFSNQLDDAALAIMVREAEALTREHRARPYDADYRYT